MKRFCVGFLFSEDRDKVLLIRKDHPTAWVNLLNGVGGYLRDGEDPRDGMAREMEEEVGIKVPPESWELVAVLSTPGGDGFVYRAFGNVYAASVRERELPVILPTRTVWQQEPMCPHVRWLIPLALGGETTEAPVVRCR